MAFKMKGHTLPGINQKIEGKNMVDGRAKSSAFQKKETGSAQEIDIEKDRTYTGDDNVVKTSGMVNLERAEPAKDSKNYASWKKAYDAAKAKQLKDYKSKR